MKLNLNLYKGEMTEISLRTNNSEEGWFKSTWYTRVPPGSYLPQIMASSRKYHDRMKLNLNLYKGEITEISVVS